MISNTNTKCTRFFFKDGSFGPNRHYKNKKTIYREYQIRGICKNNNKMNTGRKNLWGWGSIINQKV